ncbi:MAG: hypothetical protein AAGF95_19120 [Chloroflexota bacterium]
MAERRALLIGVPEYHRSEIPKLPFIQNDIERLTLALQSSDYAVQTIGVDGNHATTGIIYDAIENICQDLRKNAITSCAELSSY